MLREAVQMSTNISLCCGWMAIIKKAKQEVIDKFLILKLNFVRSLSLGKTLCLLNCRIACIRRVLLVLK